MKNLFISLVLSLTILPGFANNSHPNNLVDMPFGDDVHIETVNNHAFFVLTLSASNSIQYGDRVELVFGLNHKIELYNISGKDVHTFTSTKELVVLIDPKDLRCFENKRLRKVVVYQGGKKMVIKTGIGRDHIKIN